MKKFLLLLLSFILFSTPAFAQDCEDCTQQARMFQAVIGGGGTEGALTGACTDATHGESGTTYLLCEDFDGAVSCHAGDPSNCRVAWERGTFGANGHFDETSTKIEGTYSYLIEPGDQNTTLANALAATNPLYVFFKMKLVSPTYGSIFSIHNQALNNLATDPHIDSNFSTPTFGLRLIGCSATPSAYATGYTYGTVYNVWLEFTGAETDPTFVAYVSATSNKGSPVAQLPTGGTTCNYSATKVTLGCYNGSPATGTIDHIRVSGTQMTGVPD